MASRRPLMQLRQDYANDAQNVISGVSSTERQLPHSQPSIGCAPTPFIAEVATSSRENVHQSTAMTVTQSLSESASATSHSSPPLAITASTVGIERPTAVIMSAGDLLLGCSATQLYQRMRQEETIGRVYNIDAKYIRHRRLLVDWICEISEDYQLNATTAHVAVGYLDRFLQLVEVNRNRLQLVAMAAVVVAAKYEEPEQRVPPADRMNFYAGNAYPPKMIHHMEVLMLNRMNWRLTVVTPLHVLGVFHNLGVLCDGDTASGRPVDVKVLRYMNKYTSFFADLCLQEYSFQAYRPSLLAATIVLAARRALLVRPLWTDALNARFSYAMSELEAPLAQLWAYYTAQFPTEARQQDAQAAELDATLAATQNVLMTDTSDAVVAAPSAVEAASCYSAHHTAGEASPNVSSSVAITSSAILPSSSMMILSPQPSIAPSYAATSGLYMSSPDVQVPSAAAVAAAFDAAGSATATTTPAVAIAPNSVHTMALSSQRVQQQSQLQQQQPQSQTLLQQPPPHFQVQQLW